MRASDFSAGLLTSLLLHVTLGIFGLGALLTRLGPSTIVPEFKHGFSSIELNLVTLPPPEPDVLPVVPEVISPDVPPEPRQKQEDTASEVILDEGVEQGDPTVTTDIKPSYPMGAHMRGEEGSATIRVWIDGAGRARQTEIVESSGYPALDRAALKAARQAHFRDSKGTLVHSRETTVTFNFKLVE